MAQASYRVPTVDGEGGLSQYMEAIKRFPLLTPEDEYMLVVLAIKCLSAFVASRTRTPSH